jgi:hypothetical protein
VINIYGSIDTDCSDRIEMKIQHSLPFKEAKLLPDDQMVKILKLQGKRLQLAEFEISRIVQMCVEKKCMDKGLGVLYEFSGFIDRVVMLIQRRKKLAAEVASYWTNSSDSGLTTDSGFLRAISRLAEATAKLLHAVALWRKLNWNPRPIAADVDPEDPLLSVLPSVIQNNGKTYIQNVLKEEAYKIMSCAQDNQIDLFSFVPLNVLVVLLAPVMDVDEFQSILNSRSYSNNDEVGRNPDVVRNFEDEVGQQELSKQSFTTCTCIRKLISLEDKIEKIWTEISLGRRGLDSVVSIVENYPIIRIPYQDLTCVHDQLEWFSSCLEDYSAAIFALATEIQSGSLAGPGVDGFPFSSSLTSTSRLDSSLVLDGRQSPGNNLKQESIIETDNVAEEYNRNMDIAQAEPQVQIQVSTPTKGTQAPLSPAKIAKQVVISPGVSPEKNGGRTSPTQEKSAVIGKSANNIPLVRRVRQNGQPVSNNNNNSNNNNKNESESTVTEVKEPPKNNNAAEEEEDERKRQMAEKGVETISVVMAAAKLSRKLAASLSQKKSGSDKDRTDNAQSPAPAEKSQAQQQSQQQPSQKEQQPQQSQGRSVSAKNPPTASPSASGKQANGTVTIISTPASRSRKQQQQQASSDSHINISTDQSAPQTPKRSQQSQQQQQQQTNRSIQSAPIGRSLSTSTDSPGKQSSSSTTTMMSSTLPNNARHAPAGHVVSAAPVAMSPANLYQFQNGAFIPVVIQPTFVPVGQINSNNNMSTSSLSSGGSSSSNLQMMGPSVGMRSPVQAYDFANAMTNSFGGFSNSNSRNNVYGFYEDLDNSDEENNMIIQRSPMLSRPSDQSLMSSVPSSAGGSNINRVSFTSNSRVQSTASPMMMMMTTRLPSATSLSSRQSSINSSFFTNKQLSNPNMAGAVAGNGNTRKNSRSSGNGMMSLQNPNVLGTLASENSESNMTASPSSSISVQSTPKSALSRSRHTNSASSNGSNHNHTHVNGTHFTSKSLEAFGILQSLSSAPSVLRGEMLADSQVVNVAFRYIDMGGGTLVTLAARKIAIWWKFIYPRRRFLRRMNIRKFMMDIVYDMANAAIKHSTAVKKRRNKFLREGGATKIQRCFRHYRDTVLAEERAQEAAERKRNAVESVLKLAKVVSLCLFIHRYIKRFHRKLIMKRLKSHHSSHHVTKVIMQTMPNFKRVAEIVFIRIKDVKLREALEHVNVNAKRLVRDQIRAKAYQEREKAAVRIQSVGRALAGRKVYSQKRHLNKMRRRILSFFVMCHYKFGKEKARQKHKYATTIQRLARGMIQRVRLSKFVKAGMMLNAFWRKHKAFRTLKQNLRRVERPVTISIQQLRNIPSQLIHTDHVKIKVQVWWHPLLHIISEADFATIIQTKQPQLVYTTKQYKLKRVEFARSKQSMIQQNKGDGTDANGQNGNGTDGAAAAGAGTGDTEGHHQRSNSAAYVLSPAVSMGSRLTSLFGMKNSPQGSSSNLNQGLQSEGPPSGSNSITAAPAAAPALSIIGGVGSFSGEHSSESIGSSNAVIVPGQEMIRADSAGSFGSNPSLGTSSAFAAVRATLSSPLSAGGKLPPVQMRRGSMGGALAPIGERGDMDQSNNNNLDATSENDVDDAEDDGHKESTTLVAIPSSTKLGNRKSVISPRKSMIGVPSPMLRDKSGTSQISNTSGASGGSGGGSGGDKEKDKEKDKDKEKIHPLEAQDSAMSALSEESYAKDSTVENSGSQTYTLSATQSSSNAVEALEHPIRKHGSRSKDYNPDSANNSDHSDNEDGDNNKPKKKHNPRRLTRTNSKRHVRKEKDSKDGNAKEVGGDGFSTSPLLKRQRSKRVVIDDPNSDPSGDGAKAAAGHHKKHKKARSLKAVLMAAKALKKQQKLKDQQQGVTELSPDASNVDASGESGGTISAGDSSPHKRKNRSLKAIAIAARSMERAKNRKGDGDQDNSNEGGGTPKRRHHHHHHHRHGKDHEQAAETVKPFQQDGSPGDANTNEKNENSDDNHNNINRDSDDVEVARHNSVSQPQASGSDPAKKSDEKSDESDPRSQNASPLAPLNNERNKAAASAFAATAFGRGTVMSLANRGTTLRSRMSALIRPGANRMSVHPGVGANAALAGSSANGGANNGTLAGAPSRLNAPREGSNSRLNRASRGTDFFSGGMGLGSIIAPQLLTLGSRMSNFRERARTQSDPSSERSGGKGSAREKRDRGGDDSSGSDGSSHSSDDDDDYDDDEDSDELMSLDDEDSEDSEVADANAQSDSSSSEGEDGDDDGELQHRHQLAVKKMQTAAQQGGKGVRGSLLSGSFLRFNTGPSDGKSGSGRSSLFGGIANFTSNLRKTVAKVSRVTRIGARRRHKKDGENLIQPKYVCNFDDDTIKIPGCHGNAVIRFDFLDGE